MGLVPAIVELRKWGLDEQLMLQEPIAPVTHDMSYGLPAGNGLAETYQWDDAWERMLIAPAQPGADLTRLSDMAATPT